MSDTTVVEPQTIIQEPAQEVEQPKAPEEPTKRTLNDYSNDELIEEIRKTREEAKGRRLENNTFKSELDELKAFKADQVKAEEAKLIEDGKLKELLEKRDLELTELGKVKEDNLLFEERFKKDLNEELKGLTQNMVDIIENSGKNVVAKIEMARAIKKEKGVSTNSPGSTRVGGNHGEGNGEELLQEINGEKNMLKKAEMLENLRTIKPDLYAAYDPSLE